MVICCYDAISLVCESMCLCGVVYYSWVGLVSKNYEIERACMELEAEVLVLEHKAKKLKK